MIPWMEFLTFSMPGIAVNYVCNDSAKVWFQETADVGKVLDLTDIEELNDDWVKNQLLR